MATFAVHVLTKRGSVRIRYVTAPTIGTAKQHVKHSMRQTDVRITRAQEITVESDQP